MAAVREAEIREQKAREEGLAEGLLEGKLLVARQMLAEGDSPEEIEKLKQQPR